MGINIANFLSSKSNNRKMNDFQDLDHLDGLSISAVSANLYKTNRDDLVMFYFRDGACIACLADGALWKDGSHVFDRTNFLCRRLASSLSTSFLCFCPDFCHFFIALCSEPRAGASLEEVTAMSAKSASITKKISIVRVCVDGGAPFRHGWHPFARDRDLSAKALKAKKKRGWFVHDL